MDKILAIKNTTCLCWKCLQEKYNVHTIIIKGTGYSSKFDIKGTKIQLCEECYQESNPNIWSMEEVLCDTPDIADCRFKKYKHEEEMLDYINGLSIQAQQFIYNEFDNGIQKLSPQKWIDEVLENTSY